MNTESLHSEYIAGKRIDESFGKYRLSCKIGSYCVFGFNQRSNTIHKHNCYELCVVVSGNGSYIHNDAIIELKPYDILIADPNVQHEIRASARANLILLYIFFEINQSRHLANTRSYGDQCIEAFLKGHGLRSSQPQLLAYLSFIEAYNSPKKKFHFGTAEALKNLVLESMTALSFSSTNSNDDTVKNIIESSMDYIDKNLHEKIPVRDVASYCCTSPRNLEYLYRKHLNKTVVGYIHEKKIDLACHYLNMYLSITDTANMIGINNISYFSSLFKKIRKMSPRAYQNSVLPDKKGMGRRI